MNLHQFLNTLISDYQKILDKIYNFSNNESTYYVGKRFMAYYAYDSDYYELFQIEIKYDTESVALFILEPTNICVTFFDKERTGRYLKLKKETSFNIGYDSEAEDLFQLSICNDIKFITPLIVQKLKTIKELYSDGDQYEF